MPYIAAENEYSARNVCNVNVSQSAYAKPAVLTWLRGADIGIRAGRAFW